MNNSFFLVALEMIFFVAVLFRTSFLVLIFIKKYSYSCDLFFLCVILYVQSFCSFLIDFFFEFLGSMLEIMLLLDIVMVLSSSSLLLGSVPLGENTKKG
jgi:hypothetical protein